MPLPVTYSADAPAPPVSSSRRGGPPATVTLPSNATVMLIEERVSRAPSVASEATSTTRVGDSRISWTPSSPNAATTAYFAPPASKTAIPEGSQSSAKSPPLTTEPAGLSVPSGSMRISWTALLSLAPTAAYMLPPIANVSTDLASVSCSKPASASVAEPLATSVPSGSMRISWTPSSTNEATMAYFSPPMSKVSRPLAPSNARRPLSIIEPLPTRVPSGSIRTSWTPA